ncbi:MAG: GNAT family N-acetyltransferase [Anaerolineae bacterium]|jgi:GNAT superfamily N-acetyltransferase
MIVRIAEAEIEDAREILVLQRLAYMSEARIYNDFTIPPLTQTPEEIEAEFGQQLFLKATVDDRIVGSVRARLEGDSCLVGRLIVSPAYQDQGIGSTLMGEIESRFGRVRRFELFTGHRSRRNLYLYRKLGYEPFRTVPVTDDLKLVYLEKWAA